MSFLLNILGYFFNPLPLGPFRYSWVFIALTIVALAVAIALKIIIKRQKENKIFRKLFKNLPIKLLVIAIMEALYIAFRYEQTPYFSLRFLNYLILGYTVYVVVHYAQLYFKVYPAHKKHHEEQKKLNKYLPRKKR